MDEEIDINSPEFRKRVLALPEEEAVRLIMQATNCHEVDARMSLEVMAGGDVIDDSAEGKD